jgi:hypothetical protein
MLQGESLKRLLQGAVAGAVATMVVGFYWGGWSLGSTADKGKRALRAGGRSRAGTRVCRQIPRTAGRRGEASRAFEGRLVEAPGTNSPMGNANPIKQSSIYFDTTAAARRAGKDALNELFNKLFT